MKTFARIVLCSIIGLSTVCFAQNTTHTWAATGCASCESTITNPGWFADGSGLFTEAMQENGLSATASVSLTESNFVVAVGFSSERTEPIQVTPGRSVLIESNSAPRMTLMTLSNPDGRISKKDVSIKKRYKKDAIITLTQGAVNAGFLFFPNDPDATQLTIVVTFGGDTFRFPFARNSKAKAKFGMVVTDAGTTSDTSTPQAGSSSPVSPSTDIITTSLQTNRVEAKSTGACEKTITFATLHGGKLIPDAPTFTKKWLEKNHQKFPKLCFSQEPSAKTGNILLVFSTSQDAFDGLYPTTRTNTSTSLSPVAGNGSLTSNSGEMWNYQYSGTVTTTTTTTSQVNLAYTDTTRTLYIYAYDADGKVISHHFRSATTRQGGDGANTLGYNLGSALGNMNIKENLLKDTLKSLDK